MKYFKKMTGKKCYLSPINTDDVEIFTQWLNDIEVTQYLQLHFQNISISSEKEVVEKLAKSHNYVIVDLKEDKPIGVCGFSSINNIYRTAEVGIFIGDKTFHNKGYGTEALSLLIDYAYQSLNLYNIMLFVYEDNQRAIKCYENIGFKEMGKRRKARIFRQKTYDIIFMDIIPEDFYKAKK